MDARNARPLSVEQVRAVDRYAIERLGIPGLVLMENAARAVADEVGSRSDALDEIAMLCGRGNNGGDGFAIARHLVDHVADLRVGLCGRVDRLAGDAATNAAIWRRCGGEVTEFDDDADEETIARWLGQRPVVIDALLGTGTTGPPRGSAAAAIRAINRRASRVYAVDVPSGFDADSGIAHDPTVEADVTITFVATKPGFGTEAAREAMNEVVVASIGVPRSAVEAAVAGFDAARSST